MAALVCMWLFGSWMLLVQMKCAVNVRDTPDFEDSVKRVSISLVFLYWLYIEMIIVWIYWVKYITKINCTCFYSFLKMWLLENLKWPVGQPYFFHSYSCKLVLNNSPKLIQPSKREARIWTSGLCFEARFLPFPRSHTWPSALHVVNDQFVEWMIEWWKKRKVTFQLCGRWKKAWT